MGNFRERPRPEWSLRWVLRWSFGLVIILSLVAIFAYLAEQVWFREGFAWDVPIILAIHHLSSPALDWVMWFVTQTGEIGAIACALILAAWFARKRNVLEAVSVIVSLGGAIALNTVLKILLSRPRPSLFPPKSLESGFSFPSGHVAASVAVYGFLAVLLWRRKHRGWAILSATWVLMVALSRIYLGVHYPSDALGAMVFSSLWLLAVYSAHDRYWRKTDEISA